MSFTKFIKGLEGLSDEEKFKLIYIYLHGEEAYKQRVKEIQEAKVRNKKLKKEIGDNMDVLFVDELQGNYVTIDPISDFTRQQIKGD